MTRQSDRFYEEIRKSHTIISYVDVIGADQETIRLPAIDGQVDVDGTAQFRRKLSVNCVDPTGTITPRNEGELLTPFGTELRPYRGIEWTNLDGTKTREICPLGVFPIIKASVSDSNGGSPAISLEAMDRSWRIAGDKFKVPYVIAANTNALTAIKDIVKLTYPDIQYDTISTAVATTAPLVYEAGSDPWEAVTKLAQSMGCEAYFTTVGRLAVLPPDDVNALPSPDFTYIEGQGCTMLDLSREYNAEQVFNGVIVTGESVGDELPPVRGEAWDENPASPTYRYGPFGERPTFVQDQLAKTTEQAQTIARSTLTGILGASSQLSITGIVNPAYEANDIVRVKRARAGVDGLYALQAFNIPLRSHTQSLTLKEQRPSQ